MGRSGLCTICKQKTSFEVEPRPVADRPDATEFVVVCAKCKHETHSCWTTEALEAMKRQAGLIKHPRERERTFRRYRRKFEAFQDEMEKRSADHE